YTSYPIVSISVVVPWWKYNFQSESSFILFILKEIISISLSSSKLFKYSIIEFLSKIFPDFPNSMNSS
ncbi:MAG: hypothetical protein WCY46_07835, partial [Tissierellaceae bacterium]